MQAIRWTIVGIALALLGGSDLTNRREIRTPLIPQTELDGTWEIISVHRDGEADPLQVDAKLTFANGQVKFQPKVRQIIEDGTS